ncbi:hypothetical protein EVJ58_g7965, partial [Rhodofomes roseus]
QKAGKVNEFFTEAESEFFAEWPEISRLFGPEATVEGLSEEEMSEYGAALRRRKGQIHSKFYNDQSKTRHEKPKALSIHGLLSTGGNGPSTRAPQEVEVYSKLFYKDRIKENVDAHKKDVPHRKNIAVVRRETQIAYDNESEEVKREVRARLDALKASASAQAETSSTTTRTPADYQKAIDSVPQFLEQLFAYLAEETGWAYSVVGGGPCPDEGGALQTISYHIGTTPAGHNFKHSYMKFAEAVMDPFLKFLNAKFPPAERARWIFNDSEDDEVEPDSPGLSDTPTGAPPSEMPRSARTSALDAAANDCVTETRLAPVNNALAPVDNALAPVDNAPATNVSATNVPAAEAIADLSTALFAFGSTDDDSESTPPPTFDLSAPFTQEELNMYAGITGPSDVPNGEPSPGALVGQQESLMDLLDDAMPPPYLSAIPPSFAGPPSALPSSYFPPPPPAAFPPGPFPMHAHPPGLHAAVTVAPRVAISASPRVIVTFSYI